MLTRGKRALFASVGALMIVTAAYLFVAEETGASPDFSGAFSNFTGMLLRSTASPDTIFWFNATLEPKEQDLSFSFMKSVGSITVIEPSEAVPITVSGMEVQPSGKSTFEINDFTGSIAVTERFTIHGNAMGFISNGVRLSPKKVVSIDADEMAFERVSISGMPATYISFNDVKGSIELLAGKELTMINKIGGGLEISDFEGSIEFVNGKIYLTGKGTFRTDSLLTSR